MVFSTGSHAGVTVAFEVSEIDHISGMSYGCSQVSWIPAFSGDRYVLLQYQGLRPMNPCCITNVFLPSVRLGPSHKMHMREFSLACRIDRIGYIPDQIVECDIAVGNSGFVYQLSQQTEYGLRCSQRRVSGIARSGRVVQINLHRNFFARAIADVPFTMIRVEIFKDRIPCIRIICFSAH